MSSFGMMIFAEASGILLAYRIFGENSKKLYMVLGIQAVLAAIAMACVYAFTSGEPEMWKTALIMAAVGTLGFFFMGWRLKMLSPAYLFSFVMGILAVLITVPLAEKSVQLFSYLIENYIFALTALVIFILVLAMDFGKVRFAWEEEWLNENFKDNRSGVLIITLSTAFLMLFCLLAFGRQNPAAAVPMLVFWALGLATMVLVARLGTISRRERAITEWMEESKDYMNVIRSQRHDYNLHLHTLVGLIENEEFEQAKSYMQQMAGEASDVNDIMPLSDAVLGSLLYNMRESARKNGTDIYYSITYDMRDTICSEFECNKIIGNLLQNALDAIQTEEDKAFGVHVRIFKRRGNTVIYVENRFTGEKETIMKAFEAGYTTKARHDGIGLSMVLRTVSRAGGRVYPEFEPERIRFVVNLPNRINLEETV